MYFRLDHGLREVQGRPWKIGAAAELAPILNRSDGGGDRRKH